MFDKILFAKMAILYDTFLQMILVIRFRPASCNKVTTILVFVLQLKVVLFLLLELLSKSEVQTVIQQ